MTLIQFTARHQYLPFSFSSLGPYVALYCLILLIQGCTPLNPYPESVLPREDEICLQWLENLNKTFENYALKNPATKNFNHFPQLRVNRFLASMRDSVTSRPAFSEWLELLRQLDATDKQLEFANLPATARQKIITNLPGNHSFEQTLENCGQRLNQISLNNPQHKTMLLEEAKVPDAYQNWKRFFGLYPLARYAADIGIGRLHRELEASFKIPPEKLLQQGELIHYSPPPEESLTPEEITTILQKAYANPLGIPTLTALQLQQLLANFSPIWVIDTRNDNDRIGTVTLKDAGQPQVNILQPAVYFTHGYTRWHGKILLQLSYQIWLPAREKTGLLDLYGGALDSVIWRVTLSPEGTPIAFDSIHACGCYYLVFPSQGFRAIPPKDGAEPVLSPKSIASMTQGQHLTLYLQSSTHYLQQISLLDRHSSAATYSYQFLASEQLRSLPLPNGNRHSLFGNDGIVDASARSERFLLWPYGIASPGAMRQWGTQAIAFTGKRHFDDPFLLENLLSKR